MPVLADLERLFERVFERSTARLFRAHPQAVQLERRVERAMERARVTQGNRTTVPARYRVRLHPDDLAEVASHADGFDALAGRLADAALAFARAHGYHLPGRPSVALVADPAIERGVIEVDAVASSARPTDQSSSHDVRPAPVSVPDMPVVAPRADGPAAPLDESAASLSLPPAVPPEPHAGPVAAPGSGGIRGDGTQTLVFRRPLPAPTHAVLRVVGRDGAERTIEVDGTPLTLGRAADNGLVLGDARVSRHHARLQARRGTLVFTDLGSTNGSRLNGVRVDECALGIGDRLLVGDTVLVVEQLPG
jgi:predicted component of type VI protein secretion system